MREREQQKREGFLDAVRAIATIRVVIWHAFGAALITYFVAAMPAMFFVTGSLLAQSFQRRDARVVVLDRFRRILIPLWVFGAVAWTAMAVAARRMNTSLPYRSIAAWVLPLGDPHGSAWESGWLSSHLWYLRALVWLLLAAPLLFRMVRRHPLVAFTITISAVFALDIVDRHPAWSPAFAPRLYWQIGDFALYGTFLMLGFVHRSGVLRRVSARTWIAIALVFAGAAAAWRLTQPVPLGVVNNSHPMHLFVGAAWLAIALAARPLLEALAAARVTGPVVRTIGRRALTIYLWHTTAIIVALNLLDKRGLMPTGLDSTALILLTASGTLVAIGLFGWVEDLAAKRRPRLPRLASARFALSGMAFASITALAVGVLAVTPVTARVSASTGNVVQASATSSAKRPTTPSQQPPRPSFTTSTTATTETTTTATTETTTTIETAPTTTVTTPQPATEVNYDALFSKWATENHIEGAVAAIAIDHDIIWRGASGTWQDGTPVGESDQFDIASATKAFTAALVLHYADVGLIDLNAPLPHINVLPNFPYDLNITVKDLLEHRTGLMNYRDTPEYQADPRAFADAATAVMVSASHPLLAAPGTESIYASTNYLVLGLLLEQVTGESYDDLLTEDIVEFLGLDHTEHLAPSSGEPRFSTAGIVTDTVNLAKAGIGILRDHEIVSDAGYALMNTIDPTSGAGTGTFGYCPCSIAADGTHQYFGIGYTGSTTIVIYNKALDMTIALNITESLWDNGRFDALTRLFQMIQDQVRAEGRTG